MSSPSNRAGDYDYYPAGDDEDSAGDDSGLEEHDPLDNDPRKQGYQLLGDSSDIEYAEQWDQRQITTYEVGESHDEMYEVSSSDEEDEGEPQDVEMEIDHNYDEADDQQGRTLSYSQLLYAGDDYDEVHIAESSSSEPSPRDQELQSTNTSLPVYTGTSSRYSRHEYAPTNRATAQSTSRGVDEGIKFPSLQGRNPTNTFANSRFGDKPSDYSYRSPSTVSGYSAYSQPTVRGMNMPSRSGTANPGDVKIEMPNAGSSHSNFFRDSATRHSPGGTLHKATSSKFTQDSEPMLGGLDRRTNSYGSSDNTPGYDHRSDTMSYSGLTGSHSLEEGRPINSASSSFGRQNNTNYGAVQADNAGPEQQENTKLTKIKKKQEKRNREKKASEINIVEVEGYVGDTKNLDELLEFLGEQTNDKSKDGGKKKKDKKDKRKPDSAPNTDKKKTNEASANVDKKKDSVADSATGSRKDDVALRKKDPKAKHQKRNNLDKQSAGETKHDSNSSAAIIQTTANNRHLSRIILNGGNTASCISDSSKTTETKSPGEADLTEGFSERNIDEAIEKSLLEAKLEADNAKGVNHIDALVTDTELSSISQAIDVSGTTIDSDFFVEEYFERIKTPEPVEEEFKEVKHKKKKGHVIKHHHHSQQSVPEINSSQASTDHHMKPAVSEKADSDSPTVASTGKPVSSVKSVTRPKITADHKPSPSSQSYVRAASPVRKVTSPQDNVKDYSKAASSAASVSKKSQPMVTEPKYDLSESSFPTLLSGGKGGSKAKIAVVPPVSSWANKVAHNKAQNSMQNTTQKPSKHADTRIDNADNEMPHDKPAATPDHIHNLAQPSSVQTLPTDSIHKTTSEKPKSIEVIEHSSQGATTELVEGDCVTANLSADNISQTTPTDNRFDSPLASPNLSAPPPSASNELSDKRSTKNSNISKVVEFVGRSSLTGTHPTSKIQFGFRPDDETASEVSFGFGLDDEILAKTSLKSKSRKSDNIQYSVDKNDIQQTRTQGASTDIVVQTAASRQLPVNNSDTNCHNVVLSELKPESHTVPASTDNSSCVQSKGINLLGRILQMPSKQDTLSDIDSHPPHLLKLIKSLKKDWDKVEKNANSTAPTNNERKGVYWTEDLEL